jgi:hypothetical protein
VLTENFKNSVDFDTMISMRGACIAQSAWLRSPRGESHGKKKSKLSLGRRGLVRVFG